MTVLTFAFYRLARTVSPTGEVTTERVEIRPPIHYDPLNPEPGTEVRTHGFPPCTCPQAPACHAREAARPMKAGAFAADESSLPLRVPGRNLPASGAAGKEPVPPPPAPVTSAGGIPATDSDEETARGRRGAVLAAASSP